MGYRRRPRQSRPHRSRARGRGPPGALSAVARRPSARPGAGVAACGVRSGRHPGGDDDRRTGGHISQPARGRAGDHRSADARMAERDAAPLCRARTVSLHRRRSRRGPRNRLRQLARQRRARRTFRRRAVRRYRLDHHRHRSFAERRGRMPAPPPTATAWRPGNWSIPA